MDAHHLVTTTPNRRIPEFRPGDTVKVGVHIREGTRERVQTFEGVVIRKTGGKSPAAAFTVRGVFRGQYAVERSFPLYSPRIESVEIVRGGKVRRARLYYLRGKFGRAAKLKERPIRLGTRTVVDDVVDEPAEATSGEAEGSTAEISSAEANESKSDDSLESSEPHEEETRASS